MNSDPRSEDLAQRRDFLLKSIQVAGSAFALSLPAQALASLEQPKQDSSGLKPVSQGYRESPHVLKYYEKLRF